MIGAFQRQYLGAGNYIRIQSSLLSWHSGLGLCDSYCTFTRFLLFLETCHADKNFFHSTLAKYDTKFFIYLLGRAFKVMKNGVYFIVIAFFVAELLKILIYAN